MVAIKVRCIMDVDEIYEIFDELDVVLRRHGLQLATLTGQYKKPITWTITIEERDKEAGK